VTLVALLVGVGDHPLRVEEFGWTFVQERVRILPTVTPTATILSAGPGAGSCGRAIGRPRPERRRVTVVSIRSTHLLVALVGAIMWGLFSLISVVMVEATFDVFQVHLETFPIVLVLR
jgi:hypothetical protein